MVSNIVFYIIYPQSVRNFANFAKKNDTMMKYGYVKVAAGVPPVRVADCHYNTVQIEQMIRRAEEQGIQWIVFPELSVTGYICMDLFM